MAVVPRKDKKKERQYLVRYQKKKNRGGAQNHNDWERPTPHPLAGTKSKIVANDFNTPLGKQAGKTKDMIPHVMQRNQNCHEKITGGETPLLLATPGENVC